MFCVINISLFVVLINYIIYHTVESIIKPTTNFGAALSLITRLSTGVTLTLTIESFIKLYIFVKRAPCALIFTFSYHFQFLILPQEMSAPHEFRDLCTSAAPSYCSLCVFADCCGLLFAFGCRSLLATTLRLARLPLLRLFLLQPPPLSLGRRFLGQLLYHFRPPLLSFGRLLSIKTICCGSADPFLALVDFTVVQQPLL